jgi:hypothetical protein
MTKKPKPFQLEPEDEQNRFYMGLARAIDEMDAMKANPDLARQKIEKYKRKYKEARTLSSMGNLAAREDAKIIKSRIDRLYQDYLPDEWKKIQDQRAKARARPRKPRPSTAKISKGITGTRAHELNTDISKKLANGFREFRSTKYADPDIVYRMLPTSKVSIVRSVLENLSIEELNQVKTIAAKIRIELSPREGYTQKQKEKVMKLIDSTIAKKSSSDK